MEQSTAEVVVKVVAVLSWIGAAFCIIGGLILMFGGAFAGSMMAGMFQNNMIGGAIGVFITILGLVFVGLGILEIFIALGIWRRQNWARVTLIVLAWISGVFGVLSVVSGAIGSILQVAIDGLLIWLFQFEPTVKRLFVSTPVSAAPVSAVTQPAPEEKPVVAVAPASPEPAKPRVVPKAVPKTAKPAQKK